MGHLYWKTGLVDGFSINVAFTEVHNSRFLLNTDQQYFYSQQQHMVTKSFQLPHCIESSKAYKKNLK